MNQVMIESIYKKTELKPHLSNHVKENGSEVTIDASFYEGDELISDLIVNVKVDSYYNSLNKNPTPPSVDNLVVTKNRGDNRFDVYIIELKDVRKMASLDTSQIQAKFKTTFTDFMSDKFKDIFLCEEKIVCNLNAWIVCNRFRGALSDQIDEEKYRKKIKDTAMERLLLTKPFRFRNKAIQLELKFNENCHIN